MIHFSPRTLKEHFSPSMQSWISLARTLYVLLRGKESAHHLHRSERSKFWLENIGLTSEAMSVALIQNDSVSLSARYPQLGFLQIIRGWGNYNITESVLEGGMMGLQADLKTI